MKTTNTDILISEGRRPFWQVGLAALLYTITIVQLVFIAWIIYNNNTEGGWMSAVKSFNGVLITFILGVRFSVVNNVCLDLANNKYKKEIAVGMFRFGKWQNLPNIEYICVFRQGWSRDSDGDGNTDSSGYKYDVNVWYNTSKHFTIYSNQELEPAYEMAKYIAIRLNTDFLDASVPTDKKWVELDQS